MNEITVLSSLISLTGIWCLLFILYRDYRADSLRQDLFEIRDELFDQAASGLVDFDEPAYDMLRETLNGNIRFAHRLSLLRVVFIAAVPGVATASRRSGKEFESKWQSHVDNVSLEAKEELIAFQNRMHVVTLKHLLWSSPLLTATIVYSVFVWVFVHFCSMQLVRFFYTPLIMLDSAAVASTSSARSN